MTNEEIGRVGVACFIAALGALAEVQIELCPNSSAGITRAEYPAAVFWWLLMILGSGTALEASLGSTKPVRLIGSALVATSFIGAGCFMMVVDTSDQFCFSGISEDHPAFVPLLACIWLITTVGTFLLSFSRPIVFRVIATMSANNTSDRIENIERTVRALISLLAAVALLIKIG